MSNSKNNGKQNELFTSKMVPGKEGSGKLFDEELTANNEPVECLGIAFENDLKRREHFVEILKEKLKNPDFRMIEGFPIGEDEDILALSDPPYYTACPNPWIPDFIKLWESQKPQGDDKPYHREPFAADVSEGKNDPIYNAHSYHTKVPHKAIMRYILHYTEPGDIVFDGFCGTGMTGVAAQMCGDRETVQSLGYQVLDDGTIMQEETDETGKKIWIKFSKLGARNAVLNDLSPAATFIAYNYNTTVDADEFEREAKRILKEVEEECGWMYETKHTDGRIGKINYTVWSDVFTCPECSEEVNLWMESIDEKSKCMLDNFPCPFCSSEITKKRMNRVWIKEYDDCIGEIIEIGKQVPTLINYTIDRKRYFKYADSFDINLVASIVGEDVGSCPPCGLLPNGVNTRQPLLSHGIKYAHQFFTRRNLKLILAIRSQIPSDKQIGRILRFWINAANRNLSRLSKLGVGNYFGGRGGAVNAGILGTLYIPSFSVESSVLKMMRDRLPKLSRVLKLLKKSYNIVATQSSSNMLSMNASADYLFFDPPFGANINYSELNYLWEVWMGVRTNIAEEAIINRIQDKGVDDYKKLMMVCFSNAYKVLKPGRWITVEFSNTQASVWNSIQSALAEAGFIVSNVSTLDKKLGSFKAVTTTTAVKQDLVISAYKPNGGFEERFLSEAQSEQGVWDFIRTHMKYLPVVKIKNGALIQIPERDPRILFDQVVSYFVRKGFPVPISSQEFQEGLGERFILRAGMYFLSEQAVEYDKKRSQVMKTVQLTLFVSDEASAIQWIKQQLQQKPQTYQSIHPHFLQELNGWSKNEKELELSELLSQNFIKYDGEGEVPSQIHGYLSTNYKELRNLQKDDPALKQKAKDRWYVPDSKKSGDIEKLRERSLLKEFKDYVEYKKKKLKVFRIEAVRAGFKKAWQERDYSTIIAVAEKIPDKVLQEDPKLLMWYDQAVTRSGDDVL